MKNELHDYCTGGAKFSSKHCKERSRRQFFANVCLYKKLVNNSYIVLGDLVDILQASKDGVTVSSKKYNCICYADDILLCSTTPTGLQDLINTANKYINENGLRFNPSKTSCLLVGKNPFTSMLEWVIDGTPINIVDKISYLDSEFGDLNGDAHCVQRVRKATRAFFGLQGAGVKYPGVQPHIALEFYNTAIHSVRPSLL